jgi:DNA repair protein RadC
MWRQVAHDYADPDHSGSCDPARTNRDAVEREPANSTYARRAHNAAYAALCISGDPTPSPDDRALVARLRAAGALLGVELLDALIVTDRVDGLRYFSFREAGVLS